MSPCYCDYTRHDVTSLSWRGQDFLIVSYQPDTSTVAEISAAIYAMLDVPAMSQKLLLSNGIMIEPSVVEQQSIKLRSLSFRSAKLLGLPRKELQDLQDVIDSQQQGLLQQTIEELSTIAYRNFRARWFQYAPFDLPYDVRDRLMVLLGTGVIPRLSCTHQANQDYLACHSCSSKFVMEWFIFVLMEKKRKVVAHLLAQSGQAGDSDETINIEAVYMEAALRSGQTGLLADAIAEWQWQLDMKTDAEHTSEVAIDLLSFHQVLKLLWSHQWGWDPQVQHSLKSSSFPACHQGSNGRSVVTFGGLTIKDAH